MIAEPIRTCLGCRKRSKKLEMIRFSFRNGEWIVSEVGKGDGRGGYVHRNVECIDRALHPKQIARVVKKRDVQLDIIGLGMSLRRLLQQCL